MPTYQYACTECGEQLEVVQKFSDEPLTVCPACQGRLRKVFSAVGVVFKGSGFYKTDSRSPASAASNKSDGSDSKSDGSDSKSSTSADSSSTSSSSATTSSGTAKPSDGSKVA
jgi:putative FmdB family regulatory protein